MGRSIEPIIAPLGYDWKIGIALISSFAAREVFVSTLSTIYSVGSGNQETIKNRMAGEDEKNCSFVELWWEKEEQNQMVLQRRYSILYRTSFFLSANAKQ